MANWSDTAIILTGQAWHIRRALDTLESGKHDLSLADLDWTHNAVNLTLSIFGEGRWSTDPTEAIDFAAQHNLSGTFKDSEPGSDFFRLIEFDSEGKPPTTFTLITTQWSTLNGNLTCSGGLSSFIGSSMTLHQKQNMQTITNF